MALRGRHDADTPFPASLIHAERACHSDPRLCMCQNILRSEKDRNGKTDGERERDTNQEKDRIKASFSITNKRANYVFLCRLLTEMINRESKTSH